MAAKNMILSYCFRDSNGDIIESCNQTYPLLPASNMKVVSGYTAYRMLGRDFEFRTDFSLHDKDMLIHGDPTPLLSRQKLREILVASGLDRKDLERVLFKDDIFDDREFADGWSIEDIGFCYQARVVPFSVDEGCYCKEQGGCDGSAPLHDVAKQSVNDQLANFAREISGIVSAKNEIEYGRFTHNSSNPHFVYRESLLDILDHIEVYSCNFSIEVLTKYLSYRKTGRGSWGDSAEIISDYMKSLGLDASGIRIVDGSGLSRSNLMSTEFLSDLAHKIIENGDNEFMKLLPSPGRGTLRGRLDKLSTLGLHAKTGSLEYCGSLTGYLEKPGVFFSIIINNSLENGKKIINKIDNLLVDFLGRNGIQLEG